MRPLFTLSIACASLSSAHECPGDDICQRIFGEESSCILEVNICANPGEAVVPCSCDDAEPIRVQVLDLEPSEVEGSDVDGDADADVEYSNNSERKLGVVTTTKKPTTTTKKPTTTTKKATTTTRKATTTKATTTPAKAATTMSPVNVPVQPPTNAGQMFVWAEWPSMAGEADWIAYYTKLLNFARTSPLNVNRVMLRVLDPVYGTVATTRETKHDLWTVSVDSVIYTSLLSKLPASVKTFDVYPYLMDVYNQNRWVAAMKTSKPLEAAFKYCGQWNALLKEQGIALRCGGVTVDGEERRGYLTEFPAVNSYKSTYGGLTFGYATGYPQVGVLGSYDSFVDDFFFELYDFWVRGIYPAKLVQNSDVAKDDVSGFITKLNGNVWNQYLRYYEHPKARFMWSVQNIASNDCLYPDGPKRCGIKQDFGAWSINGFLSFVSTIRSMYPTKFGNKQHGIFQFSFVPNSWISK
jgi:hypothetical protein